LAAVGANVRGGRDSALGLRLIRDVRDRLLGVPLIVAFGVFSPVGASADQCTQVLAGPKNATMLLTSSATAYASTDDVRLQLAAKNVSATVISLYTFPPPYTFDLRVTDAAGNVLSRNRDPVYDLLTVSGRACNLPELKPGGIFTFVGIDRSTSSFPLTAWGYVLAPGTYTIRALYRATKISTNAITVRIGQ